MGRFPQGLSCVDGQLRFRVKGFKMAESATHHHEDDLLGTRCPMRSTIRRDPAKPRFLSPRRNAKLWLRSRHRHAGQAETRRAQERAARLAGQTIRVIVHAVLLPDRDEIIVVKQHMDQSRTGSFLRVTCGLSRNWSGSCCRGLCGNQRCRSGIRRRILQVRETL